MGLPSRFRLNFDKRKLAVGLRHDGSESYHEFDAVSADGRIVVSIKASSGPTSGGNVPDGKIKGAYAELHFLGLVDAPERYLVLTDQEFYRIFSSVSEGKLPPLVELLHIPLPETLQREVTAARDVASKEVSPKSP